MVANHHNQMPAIKKHGHAATIEALRSMSAQDLFLPEDVKLIYGNPADIKRDFREKIDQDCDYVKIFLKIDR